MLGNRTSLAPWRLVLVLLPGLALVLSALAAPARAADGPTLTLTGPASAPRGSQVGFTATLTGATGGPLSGQTVQLQQGDGSGGWQPVVEGTTGADGSVTLSTTLTRSAPYRAVREQVGDGSGDPDQNAAVTSPEVTVRAYDVTSSLSISAPASGYVDSTRTVTGTLTRDDTSAPVAGATVRLERLVGTAWKQVATATTDGAGVATFTVTVQPSGNTFRTAWDGTGTGTQDLGPATSAEATVTALKRDTVLTLTGPARVVDEKAVTLTATWKAANGTPVPGTVVVERRLAGGAWARYTTLALGADGLATLRVRPRVDSSWRASGPAGRWWKADTSPVETIDNVPPGTPVAYPKGAPRPAIALPRNARATGAGANPTISRISDAMWRSMVGRTWHSGCPVGRSQLRVVRVNYWGYDGYRYRGEIVLRDSAAGRGAQMFASMYRQQLPIWRMYRVDRFGWSSTLHGGNDYRSMRAGNTSGFNCRGVVGNPSVPSPHSYGRSIDLNTWENPYRSREGLVPNSWWQGHSHPRIAWRSRSHPVVRTMAAYGFRWTYGLGDTQHFDG